MFLESVIYLVDSVIETGAQQQPGFRSGLQAEA